MTFDEFLSLTQSIIPLYMVELKVYDDQWLDQMYDAISTVKKYHLEDKVVFISYDPVVRSALTQKDVRVGWDMFEGDVYPTQYEARRIEYLMTPYGQLKWKHLTTLLSYKKPIITYTPITTWAMEEVIFMKDYLHVPLSGVLVDDVAMFLDLL